MEFSIHDFIRESIHAIVDSSGVKEDNPSEVLQQYRKFSADQRNHLSGFIGYCYIIFLLLPSTVGFLTSIFTNLSSSFPQSCISALLLIVLYSLSIGFIYTHLLLKGKLKAYFKNDGEFSRFYQFVDQHQRFIRGIIMIGITSTFCVHLIMRMLNGQCPNSYSGWETWNCNPFGELHGLPYDSIVLLVLMPRMAACVFRDVRKKYNFYNGLIALLTVVGCCIYMNISYYLYFLMLYFLGSFLITYDTLYSNIVLFLMYNSLKQTLENNERKADEVHASEMRAMIGNVAHDLKTPLTSFLSGIELIGQITTELKSKINVLKIPLISDELFSALHVISNCTKNMTATNSFMLMTINRCIDYTKASKGLKLNPKYETIDVMDALSLPLNCISDIQGRIEIQLNPISREMCSHIITDKQWFQENVLCLLSNAVKYSNEGTVTITLSLNYEAPPPLLTKVSSLLLGINGGGNSSKKKIYTENPEHDNARKNNSPNKQQQQQQQSNNTNIIGQLNGPSSTPTEHGSSEEDDIEKNNNSSIHTGNSHHSHSQQQQQQLQLKGLEPIGEENLESPTNGKQQGKMSRMLGIQSCIRIEIEDNGIGISDEIMKNLFSPFKQAQRLAGGTGLGLYSLAKRMEALGGKYGVGKRKDGEQGSLFWFEFPYRPDHFTSNMAKENSLSPYLRPNEIKLYRNESKSYLSTAASPPSTSPMNSGSLYRSTSRLRPTASFNNNNGISPRIASPSSSLTPRNNINNALNNTPKRPLHILIVDDTPSIVKMTSMMLRRCGHTIVSATNGAEALNKIYEQVQKSQEHASTNDSLSFTSSLQCKTFDVIIMDLQMPIMDGLESTRRIRKAESTGEFHSSSKKANHNSNNNSNMNSPQNKSNLKDKTLTTNHDGIVFLNIPRHCIIGCSANSDNDTIEEAYAAGVDSFMAKPFSIDTFYQQYHEYIKQDEKEDNHNSNQGHSPGPLNSKSRSTQIQIIQTQAHTQQPFVNKDDCVVTDFNI